MTERLSTLNLFVDHEPVMALLSQCPAYATTPLVSLDELAKEIGVAKLWGKDESKRMGLGSFKALGGSYAILRTLIKAAGLESSSSLDINSTAFKQAAEGITFVCATAGNHGLGVAAAARLFGARAVVYIAESVPESFAARLWEKGAEVVRAGAIYQDALDAALEARAAQGWQLIADTSWQTAEDEYIEIPGLIYQGYSALAEECRQSFMRQDEWPTHIFLQAGVGGLAAVVAAHVREYWPVSAGQRPTIIIVEPDAAPCLLRSMEAGKMIEVEGPVSEMGRLDCKEPSLLTFESLRVTADRFIEISDDDGRASTAQLNAAGIASSSSGTAGFAGLTQLIAVGGIPAEARCLVIISEGEA